MQYLESLVRDAESLDELQQFNAIIQTIANQYELCMHNSTKNTGCRQQFEMILLQIVLNLREKNSNFTI